MATDLLTENYADFLRELKARIRGARGRAALNVNRELVLLYWQIGREILTRQGAAGWGAKVIERLSHDLRLAFPEMKGFSARNLKYMRAFAEAWPDEQFVQEALAQITWYHNIAILDKDRRDRQARMVRPGSHCQRLVAQRPGASDRGAPV